MIQAPIQRKTINASTLAKFYRLGHKKYGDGYPEVLNPSALFDGVASMVEKLSGTGHPISNVMLYVIDADVNPTLDPNNAEYIITITPDTTGATSLDDMPRGYAIRLFYARTSEMESVSTVEEDRVVWSPDDMSNTQHPRRTRYYMGFMYLVCEGAHGFDREPEPEVELTYEDLIELGLSDGDVPAEMIEIAIPDEAEQLEPTQEELDDLPFEPDRVYDDIEREIDDDIAEMGDDDTAILLPQDKTMGEVLAEDDGDEEELINDFEELFED